VESPGRARRIIDLALEGEDPELVDRARLVVSELVTNAVVHARTPVEVRIVQLRPGWRIEVTDSSLDPVRTRRPATQARSGRGLEIVERVSDAWGAEFDGAHKVVWAEIGLSPEALAAHAEAEAETDVLRANREDGIRDDGTGASFVGEEAAVVALPRLRS
jgi:hypothetical protein